MVRVEPAPDDLVITRRTPPRIDDRALAAEIPVQVVDDGEAAHPFVVIGDSLSHGFKSGAIHDTSLSWPAQAAAAMGLGPDRFRFPSYDGPTICPGIPLNIELLVKLLEEHAGAEAPLLGAHLPVVASAAIHALAEIKDYWEKGDGSQVASGQPYMHNLAIYGWDVRDSLSKTARWCREHVTVPSFWDHLKPHLPHLAVSDNEWRAALRVLVGPLGDDVSQITAAQALGEDGVGTLIVALGANNALGAVLGLALRWTPPDYLDWTADDRLEHKDEYTVWRPAHFAAEYAELVAAVKQVNARHVVLGTVPHVTIAPLLHGFGAKPAGSRYFPRYGRVWISERDFNPNHDQCLSGDQCRQIDSAIDSYNQTIVGHVREARRQGLDWHVLDICGLLDSLAYRRYLADPLVDQDVQPYPMPDVLAALSPRPDTRFFGSDQFGRTQGGLIALDGVHPTTVGYGIMADEVLKVLSIAGVVSPDTRIDFEQLIPKDTLVTAPPRTLTEDMTTLGFLNEHLDAFRSVIEL
ncbi:hypothetical protein [uncultured Jatrophihabitans sp.]|uniref:hypothetical protein n=1 Tax=uncultured Jatrophihabitans sp. TaxID=1610747 RepID=UPI0035CB526E